jgi:subtilisin family serine protease
LAQLRKVISDFGVGCTVLAWAAAPAAISAEPLPVPSWQPALERQFSAQPDARIDVLIEFRAASPTPNPNRERASGQFERPLDAVRAANVEAAAARAESLQSQGMEVLLTYDYVPTLLVRMSRDDIADLAARDDVVAVSPDMLADAQEAPSIAVDDRERAQLGVSTDSIRARDAWAQGFDGTNQVIAIMDTGISAVHEMFQNNKIIAEACFSGGGSGQTLCPGGVRQIRNQSGAASDCSSGSSVCDHGTHVAGIAAGFTEPWADNTRNASNIRLGVAPKASLLPIQVFSRFTTGCTAPATTCLRTSTSDQLSALNYLLDVINQGQLGPSRQLVAVNMSFGGDADFSDYCYSNSLVSALRLLRQLGVLATISSGNDETNDRVSSPACIKDALTVDASTRTNTDGVPYSNSAPAVDVVAPGGASGASISSAGIASPTSYAGKIGTSMAAPHVAGAIAVLRSKVPNASADQVEWAIKRGASRSLIYSQEFKRWTQYFLDVNAAVDVLGQKPALGVPVAGYFPRSYGEDFNYIRVYNPNASSGTVNLSLVRDDTGEVLGSTLRTIPGRAVLQLRVGDVQTSIGGSALDVPSSSTLSIYFDASFLGYAQNVLWNAAAQSLTNITSCADNQPDFSYMLGSVHTDLLSANYPSLIRIHNKGPNPVRPAFDVYNATTGGLIARWNTPDPILPNTTRIYSATTAFRDLGFNPDATTFHTNFILRSDPNFVLGHIVNNVGANLMTDMTPKCRI